MPLGAASRDSPHRSHGANRAVAEAATDGELPSFFAREDPRRGTPVVAFLITGAISTVVLLIAAVFIKSQDSLYYGPAEPRKAQSPKTPSPPESALPSAP